MGDRDDDESSTTEDARLPAGDDDDDDDDGDGEADVGACATKVPVLPRWSRVRSASIWFAETACLAAMPEDPKNRHQALS